MSADDDRLAHDLATEAGRRLLELRSALGFGDPGALRAAGDRLAHEYITAALADCRPADAVLSEEGADDRSRLAAQRVWIIDPLDGTREFGEPGRTDWAVHVALWTRDEPSADQPGQQSQPGQQVVSAGRLTAGAVALPARGATFSTMHSLSAASTAPADGWDAPAGGRGADPDGIGGPLRLVVSRSRPPSFLRGVATQLGADLIQLGSAGAKAITVLTGAADAYLHAGGMYEWDSAAPAAVVAAAGLHTSRIDGSPLRYNQPDVVLPDILVCRSAVASALLAAIRAASPGSGS
jgi:3'(2'), 5'-bisphosphate nucleotidase